MKETQQALQDYIQIYREGMHTTGSLLFEGMSPAKKAKLLFDLARAEQKKILFLTPEGLEESRLFHDLAFFFSKERVIALPSSDRLQAEALSYDSLAQRKEATLDLIKEQKGPCVLLASLSASLEKVPDPNKNDAYTLKKNDHCSKEDLEELLKLMQFKKAHLVEERGQYATRGLVVDFFPLESSHPVRVELFDDVVESLRSFDPTAQRSCASLNEIVFSPCSLIEESVTSLFKLLPQDLTYVVLDEIEALEDRYTTLLAPYKLPTPTSLSMTEWLTSIAQYQKLFFSSKTIEQLSSVQQTKKERSFLKQELSFSLFDRSWAALRASHPYHSLRDWYETESLLPSLPTRDQFVDCFIEHQERLAHTVVYSREQDLAWFQARIKEKGALLSSATQLQPGSLSESIIDITVQKPLLALNEVLDRAVLPLQNLRHTETYAGPAQEAFELEKGDLVVHYQHGIGRYVGIEKKPNIHGIEQEFFVLLYESGSKLYVPFSQAHLLTKYIGGKEELPKLHQLGSTKWKKLREATEQTIIGYAADLIKAYAARQVRGGFSYPQDGELMQRFEVDFPYTETPDQMAAILAVKKDMCSGKAMDRLICGDVGYGKTEVAMRGASKAVLDGKKQVALLAPTTVLALQHYDTFKERMEAYGIRIGHLSRFATPKQNKETLEKVAFGEIDILIGTHKILGKHVSFYNLGLVIVDEEQRFGVKAKEHLKLLKEGVDCLTLTATPIPRTLYLSLAGARDLSTINTPPFDRLPIKTTVGELDDTLLQQALLRELTRGGQVFYIHNRIETIHEAASHIRSLVPTARLLVGHGQMEADELDAVFHAFREGQADILLSTSIIENGIDIPNANTIIIDRADRFGIAELYQLRGRVGRWNRRAFAYFLLPKRLLTETAKKRIDAVAQSSGYGGGFRVAMRDLEIRGAGDLLGTDQSGQVSSIGFHLYCKLLKRAVDQLQGKTVITIDTKVEVPFIARIDDHYVDDTTLRMQYYHRLGEAQSLFDVDAVKDELIDRFGKMPEACQWLISIARARVYAGLKGITLMKLENYSLHIEAKRGTSSQTKTVVVSKVRSPKEFEELAFKVVDQM